MSVATIIEHLQQANSLQDTKAVTKFKKALIGIKQYREMSNVSLYRDINDNNCHIVTRHFVTKKPAVDRMLSMLSSYSTIPEKWNKEIKNFFLGEKEHEGETFALNAFPLVEFGIKETDTHVKLWIGFPATELPHLYTKKKLNKVGDTLSRFMGGIKCFTVVYDKENKTSTMDDNEWILMPHPNKQIWQSKMWDALESRFSAQTVKLLRNAGFFNVRVGKYIKDTEILLLNYPIVAFQESLDFSIQNIQNYLENEKIETKAINAFLFNEKLLKKGEEAIKFCHQFFLESDKRSPDVKL